MASIKQLKRLIEIERKKEAKRKTALMKVEERKKLKRKLFNLKHRSKIRTLKKVGTGFKTAGSNLSYNVKGVTGKLQKQRKSKKGIGGYLQRIADNQ